MKISKMIEALSELLETEGDIEVNVFADHGQTCMKSESLGIQYIKSADEYLPELINLEDIEDYPNAVRVVEIYGG